MADSVSIKLPDGSVKELPEGSTAADLAAAIGPRLARAAVAAAVDGELVDLSTPLPDGATVEIVTAGSDRGRDVLRHSTAHVMAQAVLQLWPGATFAIGPPVENGFYYDFELPGGAHFTDDDLGRIEARMREIVADDQPFVREEMSREEGLALFADHRYKVEIIQGVEAEEGAAGGVVSAYRNTESFVDLCRGPHVPSTARPSSLPAVTISTVAPSGSGRSRSTAAPSSLAATASAARRRPMDAARSAAVEPSGTLRSEPSGRRTVIWPAMRRTLGAGGTGSSRVSPASMARSAPSEGGPVSQSERGPEQRWARMDVWGRDSSTGTCGSTVTPGPLSTASRRPSPPTASPPWSVPPARERPRCYAC